jgi:hypothetical protein
MSYDPKGQNLWDQLRYEWRGCIDGIGLLRYKKTWTVGFVLLSLAAAMFAGVRIHPAVNEIPLVLLAGFIHSLRYLSLVAYIWFGIAAYLIHGTIYNWAEARWVTRERRKKPNQSFEIPGLRFWILALFPATFVFLILSSPLFYILFVLPSYNNVLDRVLSIFSPGESDDYLPFINLW